MNYKSSRKKACHTPIGWQRSETFLYSAAIVVGLVLLPWFIVKSVREIRAKA